MNALFILPHPDDEVFFVPFLLAYESKYLVYLTNGVSVSSSFLHKERRQNEALRAFEKIFSPGLDTALWLGNQYGINEGVLYKSDLNELSKAILGLFSESKVLDLKVFTTAFEGAHQDHDVASVIARGVASSLGVNVQEVSTYPQKFSNIYSFSVLNPKKKESKVLFRRIATIRMAIKIMVSYSTQFKTWLGLFIPIVLRYSRGFYHTSVLEDVQPFKACFYEWRNRAKQADVLRHLKGFLDNKKEL